MPQVFAKVHPKRRTPWVGILFTFIVVVGLVLYGVHRLAGRRSSTAG